MFKKKCVECIPEKKEDIVSCEECKRLLYKKDACTVIVYNLGSFEWYYCKADKKPYSKMVIPSMWGIDQRIRYYSESEVDANGNPVKKK